MEKHGIVESNSAEDLARFLRGAQRIDREQERKLLEARPDVLDRSSTLLHPSTPLRSSLLPIFVIFCPSFVPNAFLVLVLNIHHAFSCNSFVHH